MALTLAENLFRKRQEDLRKRQGDRREKHEELRKKHRGARKGQNTAAQEIAGTEEGETSEGWP